MLWHLFAQAKGPRQCGGNHMPHVVTTVAAAALPVTGCHSSAVLLLLGGEMGCCLVIGSLRCIDFYWI